MRSEISLLTNTVRQLFDAEGNGNPSSSKNSGGKDGYVA
jgi:hypothetical protein